MKKLLNTLYISNPDRYLSLDGENIVVSEDKTEIGRVPLHNLEAIVSQGYAGVSPALMGACAERNISLCFMSMSGRFLARVTGCEHGNILLRKAQYRCADDPEISLRYAKNFIIGKLFNSRWIIERATRDYPLRVDCEKLKRVSGEIQNAMISARNINDIDILRGIEGEAASLYFSVFDELILQQKDDFHFSIRNKRPPLDNVNAMLSFAYTLLASMCASALECVGLDPYEGFMHTERPGRKSLALDLMEELRSILADRFVLSMINKKMVVKKDFITKEDGAVLLTDDARVNFIKEWQEKKQETMTHPFLGEKVEWGMVPYVQALLLARCLRGDLETYPPLMWK
ncbi:MAG TPA: type I-C CRISPR-associated endonuclease Cas1c [Lachnospiraceae bacterium]|nr:type I-C CRISPR-associated endonuclease Cas1c [Lachnospiraceae bacterium]